MILDNLRIELLKMDIISSFETINDVKITYKRPIVYNVINNIYNEMLEGTRAPIKMECVICYEVLPHYKFSDPCVQCKNKICVQCFNSYSKKCPMCRFEYGFGKQFEEYVRFNFEYINDNYTSCCGSIVKTNGIKIHLKSKKHKLFFKNCNK